MSARNSQKKTGIPTKNGPRGGKGGKVLPGQRRLDDMEIQENRKRDHEKAASPALSDKSSSSSDSPTQKSRLIEQDEEPIVSQGKDVRGPNPNTVLNQGPNPHPNVNVIPDPKTVSSAVPEISTGLGVNQNGKTEISGSDKPGQPGETSELAKLFAHFESNVSKQIASQFAFFKRDFEVVREEVGGINTQLFQFKISVDQLNDRTTELESQVNKILPLDPSINQPCRDLAHADIAGRFEKLDFESLRSQAQSKFLNMLLDGIPESPGESRQTLDNAILDFGQNILGETGMAIDVSHRMGKPRKDGSPRTIFVTWCFKYDRNSVWNARSKLKTKENKTLGYRIREDCPQKLKTLNSLLMLIAFTAKKNKATYTTVSVKDFVLYLNKNAYYPWDLGMLDPELIPANVCTPSNDAAIVFFSRHSPYSNHNDESPFTHEGLVWNTVEKYLAWKKANQVGNHALAGKVLKLTDPVECKKILNSLKSPQTDAAWYAGAPALIVPVLYSKFSQNNYFAGLLVNSYPRQIGEASFDRMWGIGHSLYSSDKLDPDKWTGKNILGRALQAVREQLRDEGLPMERNNQMEEEYEG